MQPGIAYMLMTPPAIRSNNGIRLPRQVVPLGQERAPQLQPQYLPWEQVNGGSGPIMLRVLGPGALECPSRLIRKKDLNNFCENVIEIHIARSFARATQERKIWKKIKKLLTYIVVLYMNL